MARVRPEDYEPPPRGNGNGTGGGELIDAVETARRNPGKWVDVGEARKLSKPPPSWTSEINAGNKECFRPGERWEGSYEETGSGPTGRFFVKMIRLVSVETVEAST